MNTEEERDRAELVEIYEEYARAVFWQHIDQLETSQRRGEVFALLLSLIVFGLVVKAVFL